MVGAGLGVGLVAAWWSARRRVRSHALELLAGWQSAQTAPAESPTPPAPAESPTPPAPADPDPFLLSRQGTPGLALRLLDRADIVDLQGRPS